MGGREYDAAASEKVAEGAMHGVVLRNCRVLLARVGGVVLAIGGVCPHAGAPLAEGVLQDGVVTCPWHKTAFDLRDGRCIAPPAVDDLPHFPVREEDGRILVTLPGHMAPPTPLVADERCIAIVGAGAAGSSAAQTLRREGFGGRVVLIGREAGLPYDRTVLSKYALSGESGQEKTPLQEAYFYNAHAIERVRGEVASIDLAGQSLRLQDGIEIGFDQVLVATGGVPRRPEVPGASLAGVFVLRDATDAQAIVAAAGPAKHCVVLGASFIGMEAAAALRERGLAVHVVAPQDAPFETQLGAEVGNAIAGLHREKGIVFHMGRKVASCVGEDRVSAVELDDGSLISAELVVAGLGVTPASCLPDSVARRDDGSVTVDARMQVQPGVFAAGDIATFPQHGEGPPVRVEHWRVAQQQGRIAALNMLGRDARYDAVPVFWTIHFRKRLDYVGHAQTWDAVHVEGDLVGRDFLAFYLRGGVVAALAGMGRDLQMAASIRLLQARRDWTVASLHEALAAFA